MLKCDQTNLVSYSTSYKYLRKVFKGEGLQESESFKDICDNIEVPTSKQVT